MSPARASGDNSQNATGIATESISFSASNFDPDAKTRNESRSKDEWANSRTYLKGLGGLDPYTQAALMLERYPNYPPDAFHTSGRKRCAAVKRALETWVPRLLSCAPNLGFYSLHWYHLPGLCERDSDPRKRYMLETRATWLKALRRALRGSCCYWKLEVGDEGRLHIHVLADLDALPPEIPRGGEVVKKVYDPGGLIDYLSKPAAPYTVENLAVWIEAGQAGARRHNLSGTLNCPDKRTYKPPSRAALVPSVYKMDSVEPLKVSQDVQDVPVPLENPGVQTLKKIRFYELHRSVSGGGLEGEGSGEGKPFFRADLCHRNCATTAFAASSA
jgi:hypothetical protein